MVSFKCKDVGMDCKYEATAANVQELDDKIVKHAQDVHRISSIDKEMWTKIRKAEH